MASRLSYICLAFLSFASKVFRFPAGRANIATAKFLRNMLCACVSVFELGSGAFYFQNSVSPKINWRPVAWWWWWRLPYVWRVQGGLRLYRTHALLRVMCGDRRHRQKCNTNTQYLKKYIYTNSTCQCSQTRLLIGEKVGYMGVMSKLTEMRLKSGYGFSSTTERIGSEHVFQMLHGLHVAIWSNWLN